MTAQEFGEWRTWFHAEQQEAGAERFWRAQLLAAVMNGGLTRESKQLYSASELMPPDPWARPPEVAPDAPTLPTPASIATQVAALNTMMRRPSNG